MNAPYLSLPPSDCLRAHASLAPDGVVVLGVPHGSPSFVESFLDKTLTEVTEHHRLICKLNDLQTKLILFRNSASFTRLVFLMRSLPFNALTNHAPLFDQLMARTFHSLTTCGPFPLHSFGWLQMVLPSRKGGMGFLTLHHIRSAAYISSFSRSLEMISATLHTTPLTLARSCDDFKAALLHYNTLLGEGSHDSLHINDDAILGRDNIGVQKLLSKPVHKKSLSRLINSPDPLLKRRITSLKSKHAQAWTMALPNSDDKLSNEEIIFSLRLQFDLEIFSAPPPGSSTLCPCCRGCALPASGGRRLFYLDNLGHHALHCLGSLGATIHLQTHNAIVSTLQLKCRRANLSCKLENREAWPNIELRPDLTGAHYPENQKPEGRRDGRDGPQVDHKCLSSRRNAC